MTRRDILRWIASLAAGAGLAALLLGCSPAPHDGPTPAQCARLLGHELSPGGDELALVLDRSASRRAGGLDDATIAAIETVAAAKGSISVLLVEGAGAAPRWLLERASLNDPGTGSDTAAHRTAVSRSAACVADAVAGAVPTAPGTDLGEALRTVGDHLAAGDPTATTTVVVETDGLSNAGAIDVTHRVAEYDVESMVDGLAASGWDVRIPAERVTIAGVARIDGGVVATTAAEWLRAFYLALCERMASAAACDVPVADQGASAADAAPLGAPDDPDVGLPTVTVDYAAAVTTFRLAGSLLFEGHSFALLDGTDAVLAPVVACLERGLSAEIIGHAANGGRPAYEQELSEHRAEAVWARLTALVPGAELTWRGVGSTEPLPPDGTPDPRPQDRRVVILVGGDCA